MDVIEAGITAPRGFRASGINCGIKSSKRDVGLIVADVKCHVAVVATTNVARAACVDVTKRHAKNGQAQAVFVNSGNANAANKKELLRAMKCVELVAAATDIEQTDVLIASTGVIGVELPTDKIEAGFPKLMNALDVGIDADDHFAQAILTTDTGVKQVACEVLIDGKPVTVAGVAKGSGMIHPNMATMLGFITTDANISSDCLQQMLSEIVATTFNAITVDGDTSTNDTVIVMASGLAKNEQIINDASATLFKEALHYVCLDLAKKIARDGEGATKLMTCQVTGAATDEACMQLAKSVVASNLVKTAITGEDANWGRVINALGYAGVAFEAKCVDIYFASSAGRIQVCASGAGIDFDEAVATSILQAPEVEIICNIQTGHETVANAYGCNLTDEYVRINGAYRS